MLYCILKIVLEGVRHTCFKIVKICLLRRYKMGVNIAIFRARVGAHYSRSMCHPKTCYSEEQVISMLEFLIDNIVVSFGGTLFQQVVGIPMGTNCAPLLADLFLYSYESEFLQKLVKDKKIHEARAFNFTYRYIDDVLSINNSRFAEFLPLIYPPELEVKETTDTASSASFLDLYLEFDDSG